MKKLLSKSLEPKKTLLFFMLFAISMIFIFIFFDYKYKKIKTLIMLFYFFPGILLFVFSSIYNLIRYKNENAQTKIITLTPLVVIFIYFLWIFLMVLYAVIFR